MSSAREEAHLKAKKLVNEDFVVLDTETTGLGNEDEIIEISIINKTGESILNTLIKPSRSIPYEATVINGINNADVANAPIWQEIYPAYRNAVKGKLVIIYNKKFDNRIIMQSCKAYGLPTPRIKSECAMLLYSQYYGLKNRKTGDFKWHKLADAVVQCGITKNDIEHRTMSDSLMTLSLIYHMAVNGEIDKKYKMLNSHSVHDSINLKSFVDKNIVNYDVSGGHKNSDNIKLHYNFFIFVAIAILWVIVLIIRA